jgi:hypothetical protein
LPQIGGHAKKRASVSGAQNQALWSAENGSGWERIVNADLAVGSTAAFNRWVDVASTLESGINRMIANQKVDLLPKMLPFRRIIRVFRVRSCAENSGKNCQFQVNSRSTAE